MCVPKLRFTPSCPQSLTVKVLKVRLHLLQRIRRDFTTYLSQCTALKCRRIRQRPLLAHGFLLISCGGHKTWLPAVYTDFGVPWLPLRWLNTPDNAHSCCGSQHDGRYICGHKGILTISNASFTLWATPVIAPAAAIASKNLT